MYYSFIIIRKKNFLIKSKKAPVGFENLASTNDPDGDDLLTGAR